MTGLFEAFWELFQTIWRQWEFLFSPFVNLVTDIGIQIVTAFSALMGGILNIIQFFANLFG